MVHAGQHLVAQGEWKLVDRGSGGTNGLYFAL